MDRESEERAIRLECWVLLAAYGTCVLNGLRIALMLA